MSFNPDGLSIIYARSRNGCIGQDGGLPWRLPNEYAHFDQTTRGYPTIMGRRSFEDHDGALPDRLNIVVTRNTDYQVDDSILLATSLSNAVDIAAHHNRRHFVIGGAGLIAEAMPRAETVFETVVDAEIEGDTFLPEFSFEGWQTTLMIEHAPDRQHAYGFKVFVHRRQA